MPKKVEIEFCPLCGAQVFAKKDQIVNSRFDQILGCSMCKFEGTVAKTFRAVREYHDNGSIKLQYMLFPVTYKAPEGENHG